MGGIVILRVFLGVVFCTVFLCRQFGFLCLFVFNWVGLLFLLVEFLFFIFFFVWGEFWRFFLCFVLFCSFIVMWLFYLVILYVGFFVKVARKCVGVFVGEL